MAIKIEIDQNVYVPRTVLGLDADTLSPFYRTTVREKQGRSVRVDMPGGHLSPFVSTSKIFIQPGILIVRIGDYNEADLLDPLYKSVLHFSRMLLIGDDVRGVEVRTIRELILFWEKHHAAYQQVIFIGHGSKHGILFGDRDVSAIQLVRALSRTKPNAKEFISLCCQTGQAPFAKAFSKSAFCSALLAPFHSIHGCVASQFSQYYLTNRLLDNKTVGVAFNKTRQHLIGAASFRLWQNGILKAGPRIRRLGNQPEELVDIEPTGPAEPMALDR